MGLRPMAFAATPGSRNRSRETLMSKPVPCRPVDLLGCLTPEEYGIRLIVGIVRPVRPM